MMNKDYQGNGGSIENAADKKEARTVAKVKFCDPAIQLSWGQMNQRNRTDSHRKSQAGLLSANPSRPFNTLGVACQHTLPLYVGAPSPVLGGGPPVTGGSAPSLPVTGGSAPSPAVPVELLPPLPPLVRPTFTTTWTLDIEVPAQPRFDETVHLWTFGALSLGQCFPESQHARWLRHAAGEKGRGKGLGPMLHLNDMVQAVREIGVGAGAGNARMVFIDCRGFQDPEADTSARQHLGMNGEHVEKFIRHADFEGWLRQVHADVTHMLRTEEADSKHVLFYCRQGRHRSVSACTVIHTCLEGWGVKVPAVEHLGQQTWHRGTCEGCYTCIRRPDARRDTALQAAFELWDRL